MDDETLLNFRASLSKQLSIPSSFTTTNKKLIRKPQSVIVNNKTLLPQWASLLLFSVAMVFVIYQFTDLYGHIQRHRDAYIEAHKFATSADYQVCEKWPILSSACREIRIINMQYYIWPAFKEFIQSKSMYSLVSFESYYMQIGSLVVVVAFAYLWFVNQMRNSNASALANAVAKRLQTEK